MYGGTLKDAQTFYEKRQNSLRRRGQPGTPFEFLPQNCALLIIDMQRDFLEPGGFGEMLGNDVSQLRRAVALNQKLLAAWRALDGWSSTRARDTVRIFRICPKPNVFAGAAKPVLAIQDRWAASSSAARPDTTLFRNSIR